MRVDIILNSIALGITSIEVLLTVYSLVTTYLANRSY